VTDDQDGDDGDDRPTFAILFSGLRKAAKGPVSKFNITTKNLF
jgi:hypothetical protein